MRREIKGVRLELLRVASQQMELLLRQSTCGDCTFCCWSMVVDGIPKPNKDGNPLNILQKQKPHFTQCSYQTDRGCSIHEHLLYPNACRRYACAYRLLESDFPSRFFNQKRASLEWLYRVHRPQVFRPYFEEVKDYVYSYPPAIAVFIPISLAGKLIVDTLAYPTISQTGDMALCWEKKMFALIDEKRKEEVRQRWEKLFRSYQPPFPETPRRFLNSLGLMYFDQHIQPYVELEQAK